MAKYVIHHRDGQVLLRQGAESLDELFHIIQMRGLAIRGARLQAWDLTGVNLRRLDLRDANLKMAILDDTDLSDSRLSGALLQGASLCRARLSLTSLLGVNLTKANLYQAVLYNVPMQGTCLEEADLQGAYLESPDLIDAGCDSRGFRFVAVRQGARDKEEPYQIFAGCRTFPLEGARLHWRVRHPHNEPLRRECRAKVALLQEVAQARGWMEG